MDFRASATLLNYHQQLVGDRERVEGFRRALEAVVREGDVVLDLGAGVGILSFLALRAGAARVYAIDDGDAIELARALQPANDPDGRITFIRDMSWRVELPERADVIVSETLGNFGIGEGILRFVADARDRHLAEGGRIVPSELALLVAPVESAPHRDRLAVWENGAPGVDLSPVRPFARNNAYGWALPEGALLAPPAQLARVSLLEADGSELGGEVPIEIERDGTAYGLGGFFSAELAPGLELSNVPPNAVPSWAHAFLPLDQPLEVAEGDRLRARVHVRSERVLSWDLEADDGRRPGPLRQSTAFGFPFGTYHPGVLTRDRRPRPTRTGEAEQFVLEALDGKTSVGEIEQRLIARFPQTFHSPEDAAGFLSEVLARLAE